MLLFKIYLYHILFRFHWLKDILFHSKTDERLLNNQAYLLARIHHKLSAEISYREAIRGQEFKLSSQNGEDGLLLYIFSQVGVTNRTFIEFGIETGKECNTAALIRNFGWKGLLMDGDERNITKAIDWYKGCEQYQNQQLKITTCFVTTDNINRVFNEQGISGEIDLLSIDIDGNDYWIWEAIHTVNPRVVVIEYNASFGKHRSITVPYDAAFQRFKKHRSGWYHGASITALATLGHNKHYRLVCADSNGCNAFFVRQDVLRGDLRVQSAADAFYPQPKRNRIASLDQQYELIQNLDYVEIPQ